MSIVLGFIYMNLTCYSGRELNLELTESFPELNKKICYFKL